MSSFGTGVAICSVSGAIKHLECATQNVELRPTCFLSAVCLRVLASRYKASRTSESPNTSITGHTQVSNAHSMQAKQFLTAKVDPSLAQATMREGTIALR